MPGTSSVQQQQRQSSKPSAQPPLALTAAGALERLQLHALPADARRAVDHVAVSVVQRFDQRLEQPGRHPLAQALGAVLQRAGGQEMERYRE